MIGNLNQVSMVVYSTIDIGLIVIEPGIKIILSDDLRRGKKMNKKLTIISTAGCILVCFISLYSSIYHGNQLDYLETLEEVPFQVISMVQYKIWVSVIFCMASFMGAWCVPIYYDKEK